jgi:hypothetical protein
LHGAQCHPAVKELPLRVAVAWSGAIALQVNPFRSGEIDRSRAHLLQPVQILSVTSFCVIFMILDLDMVKHHSVLSHM